MAEYARTDRVGNQDIRESLNVRLVNQIVEGNQEKRMAHVKRMGDCRVAKLAYLYRLTG